MKKMTEMSQRQSDGGKHYLCRTRTNIPGQGVKTCGKIFDGWFSWKWHSIWAHNNSRNAVGASVVGDVWAMELSW